MAADQTRTIGTLIDAGNLGAVSDNLINNPLLLQLRDIHPPAAVNGWPPAPGWWIALGLVLIMVGVVSLHWLRRYRAFLYKRQAKRDLWDNYQQWRTDHNTTRFLTQSNALLRRLALTVCPRESVASLTGNQWTDMLDSLSGASLSRASCHALTQSCYQMAPQTDVAALHDDLLDWLAQHESRIHD